MAKSSKKSKNQLVVVNQGLELPKEVIPVLENSRSLQEIEDYDKMVPWYFWFFKDFGGKILLVLPISDKVAILRAL